MTPPEEALVERDPAVRAPRKSKKKHHRRDAKKHLTTEERALRPLDPTIHASRIALARRWHEGLDWPVTVWLVLIHAGVLAAPFFFTWKALAICVFLCWFTGSIGVCLGYHRALTHGSFSTYRPVRWFLAFVGGMSGEGSAITWVANHRKHHLYSDKEGDPHSPRDGKWWSHVLWVIPDMGRDHLEAMEQRFAPDLAKDPVLRALHYAFLPIHILSGLALYAWGAVGWDWQTGVSFLLWGMSVRFLYVLHVTWFVNSASHIWGYRNYETSDDSRNLWWVGLLAFGEGWHNNHHAFQRMAKHGHKWWEFDLTYRTICVLEKLGIVWNVVHDIPRNARPA
jgi:fatty-acid desaturase